MLAIDSNVEYLYTRPGVFKLCTVVIGAIALGLGSHGVDDSKFNNDKPKDYWREEAYFNFACSTALGISLVYLLIHLFLDSVTSSSKNRLVDTVFHIVAGKAVFAAGVLLIVSAVDIQEQEELCIRNPLKNNCQLFDFKVIGGAMAVANGMLYDLTAYVVYSTKELP